VRQAAVARELTKLHEEVRRGTVADLARYWTAEAARGEIVLCVGPPAGEPLMAVGDAVEEVLRLVRAGASLSGAAATVAHQGGLSRRALYAEALGRRGAEDQLSGGD
jgi:16S rRNA (cytidine1402-2'-O)-methyltransferase